MRADDQKRLTDRAMLSIAYEALVKAEQENRVLVGRIDDLYREIRRLDELVYGAARASSRKVAR